MSEQINPNSRLNIEIADISRKNLDKAVEAFRNNDYRETMRQISKASTGIRILLPQYMDLIRRVLGRLEFCPNFPCTYADMIRIAAIRYSL